MAGPKLPPDIARKLAALPKGTPVPAAAAPPAAGSPPTTATAPRAAGSLLRTLLALGWVVAALAIAGAWAQQRWLSRSHVEAIERQRSDYEQKLKAQSDAAELKLAAAIASRDAAHASALQSAQAGQQVLRAELDFAKLPDLPLKIAVAPPALSAVRTVSLQNETADEVALRVSVQRPATGATQSMDLTVKAHGFRDLAMLGTWELARGDRVEFSKPGYKPRRVEIP
ncbi:MAG TPA: hypothetical protein VM369_08510 [Candidatus Binatia bacterium]|nr:hypothetical protein [Candidatus Binatia bacterium]